MELNNVSSRIYADTSHSQRDANLDSYMADLHLSSAYQEALRAGFILGMEERIQLTSDDYTVSSTNLQFKRSVSRVRRWSSKKSGMPFRSTTSSPSSTVRCNPEIKSAHWGSAAEMRQWPAS